MKTSNRPKWLRFSLRIALFAALFFACASMGSLCYFEFSPPERTCLSCHEIREPYNRWCNSAHREVSCKKCHGGSLTAGIHGIRENLKRVVSHVSKADHAGMGLSESQIATMSRQCSTCHAREYAHWQHGGHGITYLAIFLDANHNSVEQLADDCLRCHGMFNPGKIGDIVAPLNVQGPWQLKDPSLASRPAIPCLACHQVHVAGKPFSGAGKGLCTPASGPASNAGGSLCLYSRRDRAYIPAALLPIPRMQDHGKSVRVSPDFRQQLCVQCHAPNAFGQVGSGDDRTPMGVHEGLSCLACHSPHSNETRNSCTQCHPKLSHCGLDVATMDTTFRSPQSRHNIHFVRCADCHTSGVPNVTTKPAATSQPANSNAGKTSGRNEN